MPIYKILKEQLTEIIKDAGLSAKDNGREICGLLVYNDFFIELIKVKNKTKRGGGYSFYYKEIRFIQKSVRKTGHEIIGTFHSHPSYIATPCESDIMNALNDSLMLIIDVINKEAELWHIKNKKYRKVKFKLIESRNRGKRCK